MSEMLNVGQIINTHGVIGAVKVHPLTDNMYRFDYLEDVYIDGKKYYIEEVKYLKDKVVLKLEGINSMNDAEKYKTKYIQITRDQSVELDEDTFFITDLLGCTVVDTQDFEYGKVFEVIQTGSNDVYWVKGNKEILIPVLKEIVLDINVENKKIVIKPAGEWQDED
ncbi:16S rRNA processing protein RimM [Clostridium cavendishii DSM 21758]|uniref:Ribosome maturation factor RimM n=1 Tax=Clostridium cavendishii DSM 21758 TaxID=1121302 RepID=A0A1M6K5M0_9CLOT|nr:ribosome maturation factor RimM [Clostridium cavendishii]SHJ54276.1 16S rRNA processing protein RimM [Clostridium cavendishii DSM 21758]